MELYITIWLVLLLLSIFYRKNKLIFSILILVLSLIAALRADSVGTDTDIYREIMDYISQGKANYIEPGWYLVNKIILFIGGDFNFLLWVASLMTLIPISYVIVKHSPNFILSLFFYYSMYLYLNSFNMVRQAIAISLVLLSYTFLINNKRLWYWLSFFLAVTFHYTAIITCVAVIFRKIKLTNSRIFFGMILSFFIGTFLLNDSLLSLILGPYALYLQGGSFGYRESLLIPFLLTFSLNILFALIYCTSRQEFKSSLWMNLFILFILLNNLSYTLVLGSRVILYFSIVQIILFPKYFTQNNVKQKYFVVILSVVYFSILFFKILLANGSDVWPYIITS